MERIVIIGCGGAGKSTLARQLGEKLDIPVVHLDKLFWRPGWVQVSKEEFDKLHREALAWEAGDAELAKELRVQQAALIEGSLVDLIPEWAHQIDYVAKHPYVRMCARLSVSVLTVESGRDFDHTVFGWVAQDDA